MSLNAQTKRFYTENEMAEMLGLKKATLQNKRYLGAGHPPYKRINGLVLYPVKEVEDWLNGFETRWELAVERVSAPSKQQKRTG